MIKLRNHPTTLGSAAHPPYDGTAAELYGSDDPYDLGLWEYFSDIGDDPVA